jgi:hypothetical protein
MALRLQGHLDNNVLKRSLHEVVQRHEILRTVFRADNGQLHTLKIY